MHKFISMMAVVAGVTVFSGTTDAASCTFDGVWTSTNPGGRTTFTTKLVVATHTGTLDRTGGGLPNVHIDGTFTYDAATQKIVFTNTAVNTPDAAFYACLNIPGAYTITFTDCTHFTLALVSDACAPRAAGPGHAIFTKQ